MVKIGKKLNKILVRALRKIGRSAYCYGYGQAVRDLRETGSHQFYNTIGLRTEFDRRVKDEVKRASKRLS